ncbi:hypothetical protein BLNAU_11956 [Blattamonas nauphoetae]|uniref:Uncharacterized protein n=1 Tax=Blattamonas nauphoetae TaxID=2049346 RepID=A0ABQ9XS37_9EUKA|nr:hypothetical protein BLNAU_11956 [Blattamonas nauphoetae]
MADQEALIGIPNSEREAHRLRMRKIVEEVTKSIPHHTDPETGEIVYETKKKKNGPWGCRIFAILMLVALFFILKYTPYIAIVTDEEKTHKIPMRIGQLGLSIFVIAELYIQFREKKTFKDTDDLMEKYYPIIVFATITGLVTIVSYIIALWPAFSGFSILIVFGFVILIIACTFLLPRKAKETTEEGQTNQDITDLLLNVNREFRTLISGALSFFLSSSFLHSYKLIEGKMANDNRDWWKPTKKTLRRTSLCWVVLGLILIVSLVLSFGFIFRRPLNEENIFAYWPFPLLFSVRGSYKPSITTDDCIIYGSREDFSTKLVNLTANKPLPAQLETRGSNFSYCGSMHFRSGHTFMVTTPELTESTSFTLKYFNGTIREFDGEKGKPLNFSFSIPDASQKLEICAVNLTEEQIASRKKEDLIFTIDIPYEGLTSETLSTLRQCGKPSCTGDLYYYAYAPDNRDFCLFYFAERVPISIVLLLGIAPFAVAVLLSCIFSFKTTVGCMAYPCYSRMGSNRGEFVRLAAFEEPDFDGTLQMSEIQDEDLPLDHV